MNRQMPSKGCDPLTYNSHNGVVREARRAVSRTKKADPSVHMIAQVILVLMEERRDAVLHPERFRFARGGFISGGLKGEWVLRA